VFFPLVRDIMIREGVTLCHGHQATSNFTHIAMTYARIMGITTVYTDHSLFGFGDAACIHINKVLKCMLSDVPHAICVSNTNKENLILRAAIMPEDVSVIPNAVDTSRFIPDPSARPPSPRINIVVISRMTYRKGVDLLIDIIPAICNQYPHVHWLVGGDGPKFLDLEQMVERNKLHERVELLGRVEHSNVRDVLVKGHIFLNCSLTEAFCIAIVEAASCGLSVVSTNVGGVPEVLPPHLIRLADPRADTLSEALCQAIEHDIPVNNPLSVHAEVKGMYSWYEVAKRTQNVYQIAVNTPKLSLKDRLRIYVTVGPISGIVATVYALAEYLIWLLLELIYPKEDVELAPNFSIKI
jgi:phosphatidylinositol N-acetylglucosaminyltransferase subunit A